jgi:hypothetical protein
MLNLDNKFSMGVVSRKPPLEAELHIARNLGCSSASWFWFLTQSPPVFAAVYCLGLVLLTRLNSAWHNSARSQLFWPISPAFFVSAVDVFSLCYSPSQPYSIFDKYQRLHKGGRICIRSYRLAEKINCKDGLIHVKNIARIITDSSQPHLWFTKNGSD